MDTTCTYHGNRDEMLIAYLYEDMAPPDREACERHVASCSACRLELSELSAVRDQLARWSPPAPAFIVGRRAAPGGTGRILDGPSRWFNRHGEIPVWAQIAAAALVLGVSAGAANLQITYDKTGFSVRTGWLPASAPGTESASAGQARSAPGTESASASARGTTGASAGQVGGQDQAAQGAQGTLGTLGTPWRAELTALEERMRAEMRASVASPEVRSVSVRAGEAADTLKRARALVDESERRQQRELALRMAEIANDVRTQRVADLRTIERLQSNTGVDMMRLYRMTNDLAVRVAQTR